MRVAMLAPVAWRTPPRHYGPWELVTSLLTEGLVARGVDVTLFATLDSVTSAPLEASARTATPRTRRWTAGSGRRCTSRTRWPLPASSTWCTTSWTGCRWPSRGIARAPMVTTDPRLLRRRHPAGLPARRDSRVRGDLRRRPVARSGLRRDDPSRRRSDRAAVHGRMPATVWWCSAGSTRTRARPTRSRSPARPGGGW